MPERLAFLEKVIEIYRSKMDQMAETISSEMGAPPWLARAAQVPVGLAHLAEIVKVLGSFKFEEHKGSTLMREDWSVWADHSMELADEPSGPQSGASACRWVLHGPEAKRNCPAFRLPLCPNSRGNGSAGSVQSIW